MLPSLPQAVPPRPGLGLQHTRAHTGTLVDTHSHCPSDSWDFSVEVNKQILTALNKTRTHMLTGPVEGTLVS